MPDLQYLDRSHLPASRQAVKAGIVHLGVGNFHRAHQAVYVDRLLDQHPEWGIIGASLRRPDVYQALVRQEFCYSVLVRDGQETNCEVVGSLLDCVVVADRQAELLSRMVDPGIRIVSLTVTEKGYCHDPASGDLDTNLAAVQADLAKPLQPVSMPGLLVEALHRRLAAGVEPFTVVSCDNLVDNGVLVSRVVGQLAREQNRELADQLAATVRFPCSMVNRIVPATTEADRVEARRQLGCEDMWPVPTEVFSQWVLEDYFSTSRPPFEEVGVQMVTDVKPYEEMKLRFLNGAHFALAFMGLELGHQLVSEAIVDTKLGKFVRHTLHKEVSCTLPSPAEVDVDTYITATLERFANTGIQHRLAQIRTDGSQKLGMRILNPISDNLAGQRECPCLELVTAAWLCHWHAHLRDGDSVLSADPLREQLNDLHGRHSASVSDFITAAVAELGMFKRLAGNAEFVKRLITAGEQWSKNPSMALSNRIA